MKKLLILLLLVLLIIVPCFASDVSKNNSGIVTLNLGERIIIYNGFAGDVQIRFCGISSDSLVFGYWRTSGEELYWSPIGNKLINVSAYNNLVVRLEILSYSKTPTWVRVRYTVER